MTGEVYGELIKNMVWSYSRLNSFDDCPYKWFLRYIKHLKENDMFYATYGSFMHKILERFYKGELSKDEMLFEFLSKFSTEVRGKRPSQSITQKYIQLGKEYLENFEPFKYNMVGVEKEVRFMVGEYPFVGYIDYLGELDGEYYVIDNKSRDLKPRSKRSTPTLKDKELDDMLRQLYIYSTAVREEYGKFPKALCFNCFKSGVFIEEPFDESKYYETMDWAKRKIDGIIETAEFYPRKDYFFCNFICGLSDRCCYYDFDERWKKRK